MDLLLLTGVAIRDQSGHVGRVVGSGPGELHFGWEVPGALVRREEKVSFTDKRLHWEIECLTLDQGWIPVVAYLSAALPRTRVRESIESPVLEATKHYPFTFKATLGPGPRGRTFRERLKWACRCSNYTCRCKGAGGRTKTVNIDPSYKSQYNAQYKRWRSKRD